MRKLLLKCGDFYDAVSDKITGLTYTENPLNELSPSFCLLILAGNIAFLAPLHILNFILTSSILIRKNNF